MFHLTQFRSFPGIGLYDRECMTAEYSKNGATTLSRMNFSEYVKTCDCIYSNACTACS